MLVSSYHFIFLLIFILKLLTLYLYKNNESRIEICKKWLDTNKLALNIEKTNFALFHSAVKKITEPIVLKFGRKKVTRANHVKFLGVPLDETLSWKFHLSRKLSRSVGIFYKLSLFFLMKR